MVIQNNLKTRSPVHKPRINNLKEEILNYNIPELKQYQSKLRNQLKKLKDESKILKTKIDEIDLEITERNKFKTTYKETRLNISHNNFSSPEEYFDNLEDSIEGEILNELKINRTIKAKLIIKVEFLLESGELVYPHFHGELDILYSKHDFNDFYNSQKTLILNKIQSYKINKASIQKFIGMEYIDIYFYKLTPLNGSKSFLHILYHYSNQIIIYCKYSK